MHIFGAAILNSKRKASGSADTHDKRRRGCSFSPSKKEKSPLPVQNVAFSSVKLNFRQQQKGQNEWVLRSTLKRRKQPRTCRARDTNPPISIHRTRWTKDFNYLGSVIASSETDIRARKGRVGTILENEGCISVKNSSNQTQTKHL